MLCYIETRLSSFQYFQGNSIRDLDQIIFSPSHSLSGGSACYTGGEIASLKWSSEQQKSGIVPSDAAFSLFYTILSGLRSWNFLYEFSHGPITNRQGFDGSIVGYRDLRKFTNDLLDLKTILLPVNQKHRSLAQIIGKVVYP